MDADRLSYRGARGPAPDRAGSVRLQRTMREAESIRRHPESRRTP
jgi:hypothetical protein